MAKKETGVELRSILSDIKKGNYAPVYILMGEEPYYIDLLVRNFESKIIPEEDKDFNLNIFYGNDADIDYVIGVAQQFPVMSDKKLVILKEAQSMYQAKSQLEKFASYAARPNATNILVIAFKGDTLNTTSKLLKGVKEGGGVIFKSDIPRDYELNTHIKDYCRENKFTIEDKAVELLAQYIGTPLSKLYAEINKLISIKNSSDKRITCDDIEKNIGISKHYNNLELTDALRMKDYYKAVKIIRHFSESPRLNPTPVSTAVMLKFFSDLVIAHYLADKSDLSLINTFGLRGTTALRNFKTAMSNYSPRQAVNAIHHLREFDTKSKGVESLQNEYSLMSELLFKLFT